MKVVFRATIFTLAFLLIAVNSEGQSALEKRGISFGDHSIQAADLETMSGYLSWYYNWGIDPGAHVIDLLDDYAIDYIPMAWNGYFNDEDLRSFYQANPSVKYLLGFNEPNFIEQANMTPSEAAAEWPRLEALAQEFGLEIVGPAVNWCGHCVSEDGTTYNNPYEYLDDFFEACPGCQVDYIAVHNYMCYAEPIIDYLEGFKKYDKKIWLTEFACWDQPTITLSMQKNMMLGILDYMDNDSMIYKYAWFIGRSGNDTPHIDIFEDQGGKLTDLGKLYLYTDLVHDTSQYKVIPGRIEAEGYSSMEGIQLELTSDFDGIANVGWFDAGDYLEYNIHAEESGDYFLYMRLAANANTSLDILLDSDTIDIMDLPATGGWQSWQTHRIILPVEAGNSKLLIGSSVGSLNINWINVSNIDNQLPEVDAGDDFEITLPQNTLDLVATATDSNGDSLRFKWQKISGAACIIVDPENSTTGVSGLNEGSYRFRVSVSDGFEVVSDDILITVKGISSLKAVEAKRPFHYYPNPVKDNLYIDLSATFSQLNSISIVSSVNARLYNTFGQVQDDYSLTLQDQQIHMDLGKVAEGVYFLQIELDDKPTTLRIVK